MAAKVNPLLFMNMKLRKRAAVSLRQSAQSQQLAHIACEQVGEGGSLQLRQVEDGTGSRDAAHTLRTVACAARALKRSLSFPSAGHFSGSKSGHLTPQSAPKWPLTSLALLK
jgi:hypothetical protein